MHSKMSAESKLGVGGSNCPLLFKRQGCTGKQYLLDTCATVHRPQRSLIEDTFCKLKQSTLL